MILHPTHALAWSCADLLHSVRASKSWCVQQFFHVPNPILPPSSTTSSTCNIFVPTFSMIPQLWKEGFHVDVSFRADIQLSLLFSVY